MVFLWKKKIIVMSWVGVCTIKPQGCWAGSGLTCSSGGAVGGPCGAEGWERVGVLSKSQPGGFAEGRGWLGSSGEEMQHHFSDFLVML